MSTEKTMGLPRGKVAYDGGDWRVVKDSLSLKWHVCEYVCRDRGVDKWRISYSSFHRNDLAEYLAKSRDLPKDAERFLIGLPALMQSDAGRQKDAKSQKPTRPKQKAPAVILQHGNKLRVIADEQSQKWIVQTRSRRGPKPNQWRSRDFCDNRRFLVECLADRVAQLGAKSFPDLSHLPTRFGAEAGMAGR